MNIRTVFVLALMCAASSVNANNGGAIAGGIIGGTALGYTMGSAANRNNRSCYCDCSREVERATVEHRKEIKRLKKQIARLQKSGKSKKYTRNDDSNDNDTEDDEDTE